MVVRSHFPVLTESISLCVCFVHALQVTCYELSCKQVFGCLLCVCLFFFCCCSFVKKGDVTLLLCCCGYRPSRDLVVDAVFLFLTCAVQGRCSGVVMMK